MKRVQGFFTWFSDTFRKQKFGGKVVMAGGTFILLCFLCTGVSAILSPDKSAPQNPEVPTFEAPTATDPAAAAPVASDTPEPIPTEQTPALLPGLMPADVTVNLEERGFVCKPVWQGELYYVRTCEKSAGEYLLRADIYGRELLSVDYIDSAALQYTDPKNEFAASFLGFMATMPFDGAQPQDARGWVESTIPTLKGEGDVREQVFGGVKYSLFGPPTGIFLQMGNLP